MIHLHYGIVYDLDYFLLLFTRLTTAFLLILHLLDFFLLLFTLLTAADSLPFSAAGGGLSFLLLLSPLGLSFMTKLACSLLRFLLVGTLISFELDCDKGT